MSLVKTITMTLSAVTAMLICAIGYSQDMSSDRLVQSTTLADSAVKNIFNRDDCKKPQFLEASIKQLHRAMRAGRLTARQLVDFYLERIETFDKQGPSINAITIINPKAQQRADELDQAFRRSGFTGPLHGIPVLVKDNYDTFDLPTTGGSLTLRGSIPPDDAFQVRRIREAGGIVLAKTNMAEFAFSPFHTIGSAHPGNTFNPYALNRVPAGSSGGTAAGVTANFAVIGLGTDTGNSIRGPSSHAALVGFRSTLGLTSRDGIVPLFFDRDVGGPMVRSVADAAVVLDVIAGTDPNDEFTKEADANKPDTYTRFLRADGLRKTRIGVVRQLSNTETADAEILDRFEKALIALRRAGATIVDPAFIPELDELSLELLSCPRFRQDIENYLASLTNPPVRTLDEIVAGGRFHPFVRGGLEFFQGLTPDSVAQTCERGLANRAKLRHGLLRVMDEHKLDAVVHPTWSNPPRLVGDLDTPHGDNSQFLSPHTGFPALTVPMGFVRKQLPVGLQFIGRAWSEPKLFAMAYAFEQRTRHRRSPRSVPPLSCGKTD